MSARPTPVLREPWILVAWGLLAAEAGYFVYLASAGPGAGPVRAHFYAPTALMGAALVVGAVGLAWSFLRPPFLAARRSAALACCAFVFLSAAYPIPFPAHREGRPSRVPFRMPVEGEWIAAWGGDDTTVNLLARSQPALRYALVLVSDEGGGGAGAPVVAPAAGRVVRAGHAPQLGHHVAIEVAEGEHFFLSGLEEGSLAVREGDVVAPGDPVGRVGSSAVSNLVSGPHLALHLQDTPEPVWGQGVPWFLHEVEIDGRPVARGMPEGGGQREGRWSGQRVRAKSP